MSEIEKLTHAAAHVGRVVILERTEHCGIVWTSADDATEAEGWTRSGCCGKCGAYLVKGEERVLQGGTCGQAMNLVPPDGHTDEHLKCCDLVYGHEEPCSRGGVVYPRIRVSEALS